MRRFHAIVGAGLLALPLAALSAEAGRVLLAIGDVEVERRGERLALAQGSVLESGDTVRLGAESSAQIRFADGAIVSLRERSVLRIDEYVWAGRADGSERSFLTLLAGGMRKVAGAIGRLRRDDRYGVRTATASIGIRGTHYVIRECNDLAPCLSRGERAGRLLLARAQSTSDAALLLGQAAGETGAPAPSGTYGGVSDGRIGVRNDAGDFEFGPGQFFHVPDRSSPPQELVGPPPFLYDSLRAQRRNSGRAGEQTGENVSGIDSEALPNWPGSAPEPREFVATEEREADGSLAVLGGGRPAHALVGSFHPGGAGGAFGGFLADRDFTTTVVGPNTKLTAFRIRAGNEAAPGGGSGSTSGVAGPPTHIFNHTDSNDIGAIWGRWTAGTVSGTGLSLNNQFHYLLGPIAPPEVVASKTGTFSLVRVGGTPPSNDLGQLGTFSFSSGEVNFTAKTVAFEGLALFFAGYPDPEQLWFFQGPVSGSIQFGKGAFFSATGTGSCTGKSCSGSANLSMRGIFMGPAGNHLGVSMHATAGSAHASTVQLFRAGGSGN